MWKDDGRIDDVLVHDAQNLQIVLQRMADENGLAVDEVLEEFLAGLKREIA